MPIGKTSLIGFTKLHSSYLIRSQCKHLSPSTPPSRLSRGEVGSDWCTYDRTTDVARITEWCHVSKERRKIICTDCREMCLRRVFISARKRLYARSKTSDAAPDRGLHSNQSAAKLISFCESVSRCVYLFNWSGAYSVNVYPSSPLTWNGLDRTRAYSERH